MFPILIIFIWIMSAVFNLLKIFSRDITLLTMSKTTVATLGASGNQIWTRGGAGGIQVC